MKEWGSCLIESLKPVAEMLDNAYQTSCYRKALDQQAEKFDDPSLTPSAQVLRDMHEQSLSYEAFALARSKATSDYFAALKLPAHTRQRFEQLTKKSLQEQAKMEAAPQVDFDEYLAKYYAQYKFCASSTA